MRNSKRHSIDKTKCVNTKKTIPFQFFITMKKNLFRKFLALFLLLSHSLVHHPLYHLGTAMHCPLVCPVSPMVMSEKEDADEDKGQGPQHGLEIAGE